MQLCGVDVGGVRVEGYKATRGGVEHQLVEERVDSTKETCQSQDTLMSHDQKGN